MRHALILGDVLGKIALNDPVFGRVATMPFLIILNRFSNDVLVQEYVERFAKVALSMLMHLETKEQMSRRTTSHDPEDPTGQDDTVQIRRTLVLEMMAKIIHLNHIGARLGGSCPF